MGRRGRVYIDRFEVRDGKLEEFKRYAKEMAAFVEEEEPGVTSSPLKADHVALAAPVGSGSTPGPRAPGSR
jgi:hypothetical protein